MSNTDSLNEQDSAFTDFEVFVEPFAFSRPAGPAAVYDFNIPPSVSQSPSDVGTYIADATAALKRTGMGISPKSTFQGYPPIKGSQLTTVAGPLTRSPLKGIQINSVDVAFWVASGFGANALTVSLYATNFIDNAAPIVTTLINAASGPPANLPVNAYKKNFAVPNPGFLVTPDTEVILSVQLATNVVLTNIRFYGCFLKCSLNLN